MPGGVFGSGVSDSPYESWADASAVSCGGREGVASDGGTAAAAGSSDGSVYSGKSVDYSGSEVVGGYGEYASDYEDSVAGVGVCVDVDGEG